MRRAGATLHRGAGASHYRGLSCCGAQAPDAQAQQLWLTGLVAPRHVGSSQTRARTRVSCIRQILNHCATGEAPGSPPTPHQLPLVVFDCHQLSALTTHIPEQPNLSNLLETKDTRQFKIDGPHISKRIMVTCQSFPKN